MMRIMARMMMDKRMLMGKMMLMGNWIIVEMCKKVDQWIKGC